MKLLKTLTLAVGMLAPAAAFAAPPSVKQATGTVQQYSPSTAGGQLTLMTRTGPRMLQLPPGDVKVVGADGRALHVDAIREGDQIRADYAEAPMSGGKADVVVGITDYSVGAMQGTHPVAPVPQPKLPPIGH